MPWSIVAIILAQMALLGLVIWLVAIRLQERARWRFELQARLLERFSSPVELQQFLESDGARRLLESLSPRRAPTQRVLLAVQAGIVLLVAGVGLVVLALIVSRDPRDVVPGAVLGALGLGLLIAAAVSRRLSRIWALPPEEPPTPESNAGR